MVVTLLLVLGTAGGHFLLREMFWQGFYKVSLLKRNYDMHQHMMCRGSWTRRCIDIIPDLSSIKEEVITIFRTLEYCRVVMLSGRLFYSSGCLWDY